MSDAFQRLVNSLCLCSSENRAGPQAVSLGRPRRSSLSKVSKTLDRILRGSSDSNVRFNDVRTLLLHLGFQERIRGDHHIVSRNGVAEILNLQPLGSKSKAYQVRQVRDVIVTHGLANELEANETDQESDAEQGTPESDDDN